MGAELLALPSELQSDLHVKYQRYSVEVDGQRLLSAWPGTAAKRQPL